MHEVINSDFLFKGVLIKPRGYQAGARRVLGGSPNINFQNLRCATDLVAAGASPLAQAHGMFFLEFLKVDKECKGFL